MNSTTTSVTHAVEKRNLLTANFRGPVHGAYIACSHYDSAIARCFLPKENKAVCFKESELPMVKAVLEAEGVTLVTHAVPAALGVTVTFPTGLPYIEDFSAVA